MIQARRRTIPWASVATAPIVAVLALGCGPSPSPSTPSTPRATDAPGEATDAELRAAVESGYPNRGPVACCPALACGSSACNESRQQQEQSRERRDAEFVRRFGQAAFDEVRSRHAAWVHRSCAAVACPAAVPEPH
ncbi:MAG: hypothetical protein HYY06_19495 [Deltaproteobacteria bacterium]|nr:hypothetical protein [Deltaproteobacteria bacterium]